MLAKSENNSSIAKITIIGAGIIGFLEAYYAYQAASKEGKAIRITLYDKNRALIDTTTYHIVPNIGIDEMLAIFPNQQLLKQLEIPFSEEDGLKVTDVDGINDSPASLFFKQAINDLEQEDERRNALLALGKLSMQKWQDFYEEADEALKKILIESNFNPCREAKNEKKELKDGYKIYLLSDTSDALQKANSWKKRYEDLGFKNCALLSPEEVQIIDASLTDFCLRNSLITSSGDRQWKDNTAALWRPCGFIDTQIFLPKFYHYLKQKMGTYVGKNGQVKDYLHVKYAHELNQLIYEENSSLIRGLIFGENEKRKINPSSSSHYVFCPGEKVGTLDQLGLMEPPYAGFAGPSLRLTIPIPQERIDEFKTLDHSMGVNYQSSSVAWRAFFKDGQVFLGVGGTKAFYADKCPKNHEEFALTKHVLQLNMMNKVFPKLVTLALGKTTAGMKLTKDDLFFLEQKQFAKRWVGRRAVTANGFPTLGGIYRKTGESIPNGRATTHFGAGGVSYAHGGIHLSRLSFFKSLPDNEETKRICFYSRANRCYQDTL